MDLKEVSITRRLFLSLQPHEAGQHLHTQQVSITRRLFLSLQQVATIPKLQDFLRQKSPKITQTYFLLKNPGGLRIFRS